VHGDAGEDEPMNEGWQVFNGHVAHLTGLVTDFDLEPMPISDDDLEDINLYKRYGELLFRAKELKKVVVKE
jgi:hypothetical protein